MLFSSAAAAPPAWYGLWRAGEQYAPDKLMLSHSKKLGGLTPEELVPPEIVVFDPAEVLKPSGFSFGAMLEGVVWTWRAAQPGSLQESAAADFYCSAKELLFYASRKVALISPEQGRLEFGSAGNPVRARLREDPHCGSALCNGDYACDACDEFDVTRLLGGVRLVSAADLYRFCDQLFAPTRPGRMMLAHALASKCSAAAGLPPSALSWLLVNDGDRLAWTSRLPSLIRLLAEAQARTLSTRSLALAFADAVASDCGLSDEELQALAGLIGPDLAEPGVCDLAAALVDSVETLRAVFA